MKTLLTCLLLTLGASCCTVRPLDLSTRMSLLVESPVGSGSAFPLTEDSYLTAWHVVMHWTPESIRVDGVYSESITRIAGQDAAIIFMAEPHGYTPWILDVRELLPGERVYLSGWGVGLHWWSEGFATNDPNRLSLNVAPGDSGGPVMDADGDVVGIVVRKGIATHHCWMIPLMDLDLDL